MSVPRLHGSHARTDWVPYSWAGLWDALRTQKHSLVSLNISYIVNRVQLGVAARFCPVYAWQIGTLGSFADFNELKQLRVPADPIISGPGIIQCLPVGLEYLNLLYDEVTETADLRCMETIVAVIASNMQTGRQIALLYLSSKDFLIQLYHVILLNA
ncbi:uncharacterized protein CC84DRAFT_599713 [Paraphaeosphaeria sporulosa]|uniref:Uncharacterized protein n=1 Tax=Paraphaeosphaeria sporulosa TaxID=1460663 RepID=A0A177CPX4_9PLEO|nr:uncharacterized protein CC84DRAFT_599713 [Paraphaeosphaeria sporulosa]OAG08998.1 hypothetical protein CC84DRAFT_599713 [Paraphaeosphaeria sporulosa]